MHASTFDRYRPRASAIHRLDPRAKVLIALAAILSTVLLPDGAWLAFALTAVALIATAAFSRLGWAYTLTRSLIALPFALAAVTSVFTLPGVPRFSLHLGSLTLTATDAGLRHFASILIRSWLAVQVAILLTAVTSFPDLMHALRHLRLPGVLVTIVSFMYRYLFVLADEVVRMLRAREARSAARVPGGRSPSVRWRARVAGHMAGQLFLRSYARSERVYQAMLARGYRGELLTLNPHRLTLRDGLAGGIALSVLLLIQAIARL